MYIYNTIFCIIVPLYQIIKKNKQQQKDNPVKWEENIRQIVWRSKIQLKCSSQQYLISRKIN